MILATELFQSQKKHLTNREGLLAATAESVPNTRDMSFLGWLARLHTIMYGLYYFCRPVRICRSELEAVVCSIAFVSKLLRSNAGMAAVAAGPNWPSDSAAVTRTRSSLSVNPRISAGTATSAEEGTVPNASQANSLPAKLALSNAATIFSTTAFGGRIERGAVIA